MSHRRLFFDDFSSGELDRSKWNVWETGVAFNDELQAYIDSPETIYIDADAGDSPKPVLVLHALLRPGFHTSDGQDFDFVSGRIDTRHNFEFTHGRASARIKLPLGVGLWPAFWILGNDEWPDTGEIDTMEYVGDPSWVSSAVHGPGYSGESGLVNNHYFRESDATQWHIYTVERHPDEVTFFVDDELVYRVTRPMAQFFGPWVFDNEKYLILNLAVGGVYPFKTNGVETPYYGLPQETVDRIRSGDARVLIDWVEVTGH